MSIDDLILSIDRLSRLKIPELKYHRVYKEIISKYLINPQISLKNFDLISPQTIVKIIEIIWNGSISQFEKSMKSAKTSHLIASLDKQYFKNIPEVTKILMNASLDIYTPLAFYTKKLPDNLALLQELISSNTDNIAIAAKIIRENKLTKFPIEKIVLAEGITEEILLPVFAKKLGYDFNKYGIYVIGAGGKSKIPILYNKLKDKIKLPIIMIMDNDASTIYHELIKTMKKQDKAIIIENGEFEDILPKCLIKRSFNQYFYDIEKVTSKDFMCKNSMCENISNIYKSRQIGEFQKAHFAKIIAQNVKYKTDTSKEIGSIINEIKST